MYDINKMRLSLRSVLKDLNINAESHLKLKKLKERALKLKLETKGNHLEE